MLQDYTLFIQRRQVYICSRHVHFFFILRTHTDTDFRTSAQITINPPGPMACIDFTSLVVDDDVAMEGDEAFTIQIRDSVAVVTILDDDGEYILANKQ